MKFDVVKLVVSAYCYITFGCVKETLALNIHYRADKSKRIERKQIETVSFKMTMSETKLIKASYKR